MASLKNNDIQKKLRSIEIKLINKKIEKNKIREIMTILYNYIDINKTLGGTILFKYKLINNKILIALVPKSQEKYKNNIKQFEHWSLI